MLEFKLKDVLPLCDHAEAASSWGMGYDDTTSPRPALFLVGDRGVYLMSNGVPGLPHANGGDRQHVVYAKGLDPERDEDWYDAKRVTWGGDDGAETLDIISGVRAWVEANPEATRLLIDLKDDELHITIGD